MDSHKRAEQMAFAIYKYRTLGLVDTQKTAIKQGQNPPALLIKPPDAYEMLMLAEDLEDVERDTQSTIADRFRTANKESFTLAEALELVGERADKDEEDDEDDPTE